MLSKRKMNQVSANAVCLSDKVNLGPSVVEKMGLCIQCRTLPQAVISPLIAML